MADQFPDLSPQLQDFLSRQKIFFTGSAAESGRVNISPRPTDVLRIISPTRVGYLDYVGSGNETAAHLRRISRLTMMVCAFEGPPRILRMYGTGAVAQVGSAEYDALLAAHWDGDAPHNARAIVTLDIDLVQTSCGYGVPLFDHVGDRKNLQNWAAARDEAALAEYRQIKNARSIDGFDTGLKLPDAKEPV